MKRTGRYNEDVPALEAEIAEKRGLICDLTTVLKKRNDEIAKLRAALEACSEAWSSSPGTVMSAAAELRVEFQRRMDRRQRACEQRVTGEG